MSAFALFYVACAMVFCLTDMVCGDIAGSKPRPLASLFFGIIWPLSYPLVMFASAVIIARMRATQLSKEQT